MIDKRAVYVAVSVGAVTFALAFVLPQYAHLPVPWYYPLEHRWALEIKARGLAMDWYGRTLFAIVVAAALSVIGYVLARRWKPSERAPGLWAAWVATACAVAMAYYVYQLAPRVPTPEPLPSWYVPR